MTDHCCAHPKCPGGSLCCCQGQPDPIERAAEGLMWNYLYLKGAGAEAVPQEARKDHTEELARAVFASIDPEALKVALICTPHPDGLKVGHVDLLAQAVINHLLGETSD